MSEHVTIHVQRGWRVHVSAARAAELLDRGWVILDAAGEHWLTADGARALLDVTVTS